MADDAAREVQGGVHGRRQVSPGLVAGVALGVLLLVFVLQNTDDVAVSFLWLDTRKPLWIVLLVTSVVAVLAAELAGAFLRRRRRRD
jgi:uncharacterized integral membrane protein